MALNIRYPGVKDVAQVTSFQFSLDLPSPINVLLFAFDDGLIDLATACKVLEIRFDQTSSLREYCEQLSEELTIDAVAIQAFLRGTKDIKKI